MKVDELAKDPQNSALSDAVDALRKKCSAYKLEQFKPWCNVTQMNRATALYGQLLFVGGEIDAAIKELQLAQRSPKVRIDAWFTAKLTRRKDFWIWRLNSC